MVNLFISLFPTFISFSSSIFQYAITSCLILVYIPRYLSFSENKGSKFEYLLIFGKVKTCGKFNMRLVLRHFLKALKKSAYCLIHS